MKILHTVEFYHPSVGGMQEVVQQLSERLAAFGHDVSVATRKLPNRATDTINGVKIHEFDIEGNSVNGMTGEVERYQEFLVGSDFDVITNFAAQQWATDAAFPRLDEIGAKKVFVPTGFSSLLHPRFTAYFESMKEWMKKYDMNVFLSDHYRDIDFARAAGVQNITVIPNGACEKEFLGNDGISIRSQLGLGDDRLLILHVGSHTGQKGHAAAIEIFQKAAVRNATFLLVGNDVDHGCLAKCLRGAKLYNFSPLRFFDSKKIIVTSLSRAETVAAYKEADLFLFPSNVECSPLVLFECMASHTPFLTTDVGNAAEIISWSGGGILLPTEKDEYGNSEAKVAESAALLAATARDVSSRAAMAASGFAAWRERFTWKKLAEGYESLYLSILRRS